VHRRIHARRSSSKYGYDNIPIRRTGTARMARSSRRRPERPPRSTRAAAGPEADDAASPPRIIGDDLRRRRLAHEPDGRTRPMKDRVREALFDLLGVSVRGGLALDLFAGTGALGFEAISRGAARAVFVERHFPTADTIRRSARELDVADRCDVRSGDVLLWSRRMPELPAAPHWIVFISPPWAFFGADHEHHAPLLALIDAIGRAAPPGSTLVVEADTTFDPAALPDAAAWTTRPIPPAVLHFREIGPR
jgi:16S rRNA (guanine966-N2)-methyltransferase